MKVYCPKQLAKGLLFFLAPLFLHAQVMEVETSAPPLPTEARLPSAVPIPPPGHLAKPVPVVPVPGVPGAPMPLENQNSVLPIVPAPLDRSAEIIDFWFGILPGPNYFPEDKKQLWFAASPEIDRLIRQNFMQDMMNAARGEYNSWRETPKGRLALILLLDQFPRHIYRNQSQAYQLDPMARGLVLEGLQKGDDKDLYPIERAFFYLPLEHAEDPAMQALSVRLYQQLLMESPPGMKFYMKEFLRYAIAHQQQIARFGRFPHRNVALRRQSTPEETLFLKQWGRGFAF